jgi:hypothetical protein
MMGELAPGSAHARPFAPRGPGGISEFFGRLISKNFRTLRQPILRFYVWGQERRRSEIVAFLSCTAGRTRFARANSGLPKLLRWCMHFNNHQYFWSNYQQLTSKTMPKSTINKKIHSPQCSVTQSVF